LAADVTHYLVIAFGGGVVGDLAGFVAATYMRGVPLLQVPTTVMAMVDSSIGGKTAINLPQGKNLIGSFHDPRLVIADFTLLDTLSPRLISEGIAEVIKMGIIRSRDLLELLEETTRDHKNRTYEERNLQVNQQPKIHRLISWAVKLKAEVVELDAKEASIRSTLNFGHTAGHAIEAAAINSEESLLHGECVGIGMLVEIRAQRLLENKAGSSVKPTLDFDDLEARVKRLLQAFGLPIRIPTDLEACDLLHYMSLDKKNAQGQIRQTMLAQVGEAISTPQPVPTEIIQEAISHYAAGVFADE